jgi:hypothetical protein
MDECEHSNNKYSKECLDNEIEQYTEAIGCFVNVEYETYDGKINVAKGLLKDVINSKLVIYHLTHKSRFWRVSISSIKNFNSKQLEEAA